jgi:hypothetical protein
MEISKEEYFFYEWIILSKCLTQYQFEKLTLEEFESLKIEYEDFKSKLN